MRNASIDDDDGGDDKEEDSHRRKRACISLATIKSHFVTALCRWHSYFRWTSRQDDVRVYIGLKSIYFFPSHRQHFIFRLFCALAFSCYYFAFGSHSSLWNVIACILGVADSQTWLCRKFYWLVSCCLCKEKRFARQTIAYLIDWNREISNGSDRLDCQHKIAFIKMRNFFNSLLSVWIDCIWYRMSNVEFWTK